MSNNVYSNYIVSSISPFSKNIFGPQLIATILFLSVCVGVYSIDAVDLIL